MDNEKITDVEKDVDKIAEDTAAEAANAAETVVSEATDSADNAAAESDDAVKKVDDAAGAAAEETAKAVESAGEITLGEATGIEAKAEKGEKKPFAASIYEVLEMFAICAAVVLLVFTFVARLTVVDGPSMENTLHEGQFIVIR